MVLASATVLAATAQIGIAVPAIGGEPVWEPETLLASGHRGASLTVDAQSNTWAVWESPRGAIKIDERPADGAWGEPTRIAQTNSAMAEPQVAADARGTLTVVWITQRRGFTDGVKAVTRDPLGHWSDPVRISDDKRVPGYGTDGKGAWGARWLDLAVSPTGSATVAWAWGSEDRRLPWRIQSAYRPIDQGWRDIRQLTKANGARLPQVGIAADGAATLLYTRQVSGHPQRLLTMVRVPGAGWGDKTVLATRGYGATLMVDRAGDAMVVYMPTVRLSEVVAVYRRDGGHWGSPYRLSPDGVHLDGITAAAMNGRGSAMVAWARRGGRVDVVRRPRQGTWSAPEHVVDATDQVSKLAVALNGAGDALLTWGQYALYGTYLPGGGGWTSPVTLSPETAVDVLESIDARVAPNGDAVVMWDQEDMPLKVRVGDAFSSSVGASEQR
jgi:hypothetical protein